MSDFDPRKIPGLLLDIGGDGSDVYDEGGNLVALLDMSGNGTHAIDGQAVSQATHSALERHVPGDPLPPWADEPAA